MLMFRNRRTKCLWYCWVSVWPASPWRLWLEKSPKPSTNQPRGKEPGNSDRKSTAIREIETLTMEPDQPLQQVPPRRTGIGTTRTTATPELSTTDGEADDSPRYSHGASLFQQHESGGEIRHTHGASPAHRRLSSRRCKVKTKSMASCLPSFKPTTNSWATNRSPFTAFVTKRMRYCEHKSICDGKSPLCNRKKFPDQPQEVHLAARVIFGMALIQTSHLSSHLTTTCPDQTFAGLAELAVQLKLAKACWRVPWWAATGIQQSVDRAGQASLKPRHS